MNRDIPKNGIARIPTDDLEALLDSCRLRGRKGIIPPKPPKIYFDADRFRWLFAHGSPAEVLFEAAMTANPKTRQEWRDWLDARMRQENYE